jgi:acetyl-CoA carboxylase biotin carboxyl carrier protein
MPGKNSRKVEQAEDPWGLRDIRELIDVLIEREIAEFEMERNGLRIRIRRGGAKELVPAPVSAASSPLPISVPAVPASTPDPVSRATSPAPVDSSATETSEELHIVKSPIVGTFYATPAPNAPPFIKPGDKVQVGQVLCIIEAMKLMNEIESEVAGEVVRTYVESGQPVEYGESLFAIKTSHKK